MIPIKAVADMPRLKLPPPEGGAIYRFHTMVKPSGAQCNLDCTYCFYLHKEDLLHQPKMPRMSESLLAAHIRQYIEAHTGDRVDFSWQGGEPTLMGLDFFRRVVALQQQFKKPGQRIDNDLQTNGTLLDEEWCAFLKQHDFLVGLSIDGPAELHDLYRYSKGGKPTHERVMKAAALLHAHGVPFNALCVVNRTNARRPIDVYRFLRDQVRPRIIQFIPAVERRDFHAVAPGKWPAQELPVAQTPQARPGQPDSVVTDWSVDPEDWGYFLGRVWDEWFARDFGRVYVDQFENVVSMMFDRGSQKCVTSRYCGKALALEHNGDLYSCDHFVYPEYRLGNIADEHEGDLAFSLRQEQFARAKSDTLPRYCRACPYLQLCWGDCPKDRFLRTPDGEPGLHYLCAGLKQFYRKALAAKGQLAGRLAR
ncbi:anaerobic sulfatase maturase [Chitiniphilus shinanonensis]|uniref:Anaerobic sulfatase maturase n=1 Tax=Chitiniphilus shinanonensis TaxID=553088 RepID=A0ABQ6BZ36_9NEIS|nr:anaerobic sulfatase maturase [Chitiniphilus shinanonensis]GLS05163.1 anaerobic sulfatase maturase [Chitiniphilus shinanonensis]